MSEKIASLELELKSSSESAVGGLESLAKTLEMLKSSTKSLGLGSVAKQMSGIRDATNGINSTSVSNLEGLAKAMQLLSGIKISASLGNQITKINEALSKLNVGDGGTKIQELVTALKPLETLGKNNLGSTVNALNKLPEALSKIDMRELHGQIDGLTRIMRPLAVEMEKIANGFKAFPSRIQKLITSNEKLQTSNKKTSLSFAMVAAKFVATYMVLKKGVSTIMKFIDKSSTYTENMNLFTVAMGQYASEAKVYADNVGELLGIDPGEWARSQGVFMTLATGFGVAGDRASVMSQQLTQLGYDISSFYNISVEDAMTKLQSGLSGELEPLRRLGYDLSQAKLEATALSLGIDKSVSSMTQAEKAELRYHAILNQVTTSHGDMARTIASPANQMRILKAQVEQAGRAIGNVFIPVLTKVLPYLSAFFQVVKSIADLIASLVGFEPVEFDNSGIDGLASGADGVTEGLDNATEAAKKLKNYTMGFDELNVIDPNSGGSDDETATGGGFDFDLTTYDFLKNLEESPITKITEKMKEWLGITDEIDSWSELMDTRFGAILGTVGLIGGALLAWKIADGVSNIITKITKLSKLGSFGLGLTLTIAGLAIGAEVIEQALSEGLNNVNPMALVGASGSIIIGASLIGKSLGSSLIGFAVGAIIVGVAGLGVGLYDAIQNELNVTNGLVIAGSATLLGIAVSALIPMVTTAVGAIMGAVAGAAIVGATWIFQNTESTLTKVGAVVSAAALAVGAILAFSGANVPLGIGLMVAGAVTMGSAIALNTNALSDDVKRVVAVITGVVSLALLAVGAVLAFSGANVPLGIALLAGGALAISTVIVPNWNTMSDAMAGPIGLVTGIVGAATLALGAVLAFSGANVPLGIGLMLAGAGGLAAAIVPNWNTINKSLQGTVGAITGIISGALLVLGAILLFTGAGVPLGMGLMVAGAAGLGSTIAVNWDFLLGKIKTAWSNIKGFWKKSIAPVFTAEWWTKLAKKCGNGLIGGFEATVNSIITLFEKMLNFVIGGLNKISISIPDWVPEIGGKKFGVNLPKVTLSRVSIERFAEGGFPEQGQMFIAREAGAEMVGSIGRRTAVANNDQIVAGITSGVAEANSEQNALLREQNQLLRALLNKDTNVTIDGRKVTKQLDRAYRERGAKIITGGAY